MNQNDQADAAAHVASILVECLRWNPQDDEPPALACYAVPYEDDMSVLQALQHIVDELDGSLTFRWSCRMGVCGSCGMMIDGKPRLACSTFLRDLAPGPVRVEPLAHFPVMRDLAIDQNGFLDQLERVTPWLVGDGDEALPSGTPRLQTPAEMAAYYGYSRCINCLLCYAACPQYGLDDSFVGPGALALLARWDDDTRDTGNERRAAVINAQEGVWSCTLVGYCSEVCPKDVDPARAINRNKVTSLLDYVGARALWRRLHRRLP